MEGVPLKIVLKAVGLIIAIAILAYAGDYAQFHFRVWRNQNAFGTVSIQQYYAVHEKNNKIEYMFNDQPQDQTCVHALFPHAGDEPCWYLSRHREKRVDI